MTVLKSFFKKGKFTKASKPKDNVTEAPSVVQTAQEVGKAPAITSRVPLPSDLLDEEESSIFSDALENIQQPPEAVEDTRGKSYAAYKADGLPAGVILRDGYVKQEYNYAPLMNGSKVLELWNDTADTLIYLGVKDSPRPPSFLVDSHTLLAQSEFFARSFSPNWQSSNTIDSETYPSAKFSLYFTPDNRDESTPGELLRHYITIRNIFASIYSSFCVGLEDATAEGDEEGEWDMLGEMGERMMMYFEGADQTVGQQLGRFVTESGLWDVRDDPGKALDLLSLSSSYGMENLYKESFVHCVGMFPDVEELGAKDLLPERYYKSLKYAYDTSVTSVSAALGPFRKFQYKDLWSTKSPTMGAPSSWRNSHEAFRQFLFLYYKTQFSQWPPKNLGTMHSRKVAMTLQADFAALWDLMVDRTLKTVGVAKEFPVLEVYTKTLAHLSVGPNIPILPYGVPRFPGPAAVRSSKDLPDYATYKFGIKHKLSIQEVRSELEESYNHHPSQSRPIVAAFKNFEAQLGKGVNVKRLGENRAGVWLLIYASLGSLSRVVVEEEVHFKQGVEYMLSCAVNTTLLWERRDEEDDGVFREIMENEEAEAADIEGRYKESYCWKQGQNGWGLMQTTDGVRDAV